MISPTPQSSYQNFQLNFNCHPSSVLHLDLNSCFATIEQQANPQLRGRPVAVAAYATPSGCILAASTEAKRLGVRVGLRVKEGRLLCPELIVKEPDPPKYRHVHVSLRQLLAAYTDQITPKSIDEFVLHLEGYPALSQGLFTLGKEIKQRIKKEIGAWLTVSIGFAPNRFLAKTASSLHKPDGLDEINYSNFHSIYTRLKLEDLCGIAQKNAARLHRAHVFSVWDMYQASLQQLQAAFQSVLSRYWYLKLRGWEIDAVDPQRHSFGNSYALPKPLTTKAELAPILTKLTQKMTFRLRQAGWQARGVYLAIVYRDRTFWHQSQKTHHYLFDSREIYQHLLSLFDRCPYHRPVAQLAVSVFNLTRAKHLQLDLFHQVLKQHHLNQAQDKINRHWGHFTLTPARMLGTSAAVIDRIAFGNIQELSEIIL